MRFGVSILATSLLLSNFATASTVSVELVLATGQPVPGIADSTIQRFGNFGVINDAGVTAYAPVYATPDGGTEQGVLMVGDTVIARTGDPAPNLPGLTLGSVNLKAINNSGQAVYTAALKGPGVTNTNFLAHFGPEGLIARMGDVAPDTGGGRYRSFFGTADIDDAGTIVFHANLEGGNVSFNAPALFSKSSGESTELVLRTGQTAPDGAVYNFISPYFSLTKAGKLAFIGQLPTGGSVTPANNFGIFTLDGPILRNGDAIPDFANDISIVDAHMNESGNVAIIGNFKDGSTNSQGIFTDKGVIALRGDKAPGTEGAGEGINFLSFAVTNTVIGDAGDVVFGAFMTGPGGVGNFIDRFRGTSLFWASPDGTIYDLMLSGTMIDFGGGDVRRVKESRMRSSGISTWGVSFLTNFEDGSQALFRARSPWETVATPPVTTLPHGVIPLPAAGWLLLGGIGIFAGLARRRRVGA